MKKYSFENNHEVIGGFAKDYEEKVNFAKDHEKKKKLILSIGHEETANFIKRS